MTKHSCMTVRLHPVRILERAVARLPAGSTLAFVRDARALDAQEALRTFARRKTLARCPTCNLTRY
ncbi:MAG: hypothetical protein KF693_18530 [Nitrospira sp.]|nr:hypothetical protein [Nitrospira sp.]